MPLPQRPTYVILAPGYSDAVGGSMFLHKLADELAKLGETAALWPLHWRRSSSLISDLWRRTTRKPKGFMLPATSARLARMADLKRNAIVVYPEVVSGNPLRAEHVVRWLMYPPSIRGTQSSFGPNDLYFKASDFSDDVSLTGGAQLLHLFAVHPAYRDHGAERRHGTCYMLRKQTDKPVLHDPMRDLCLDGMDHAAIAEAFNRCERFICYDEATMYAQFAALCGCLPIVVPGIYQTRAAWAADRPIAKYGVAFGLDDTRHAIETRALLADHLRDMEAQGRATVREFVATTKATFGFT